MGINRTGTLLDDGIGAAILTEHGLSNTVNRIQLELLAWIPDPCIVYHFVLMTNA
jgi:hypothetical protein